MQLGIIGARDEKAFQSAQNRGLSFIELCVNDGNNIEEVTSLEQTELINGWIKQYEMPVKSVGCWGPERITAKGINEQTIRDERRLIRWCKELGASVYVTGCNYIDELSLFENITFAVDYFERLLEEGKQCGIKIAVYNCRWNNFVHSDPMWKIIMGHLSDLYIKYDPSHSIYDGGDYMMDIKTWGHRFAHVHIKGSLYVGGERVDDPPAGLDQTNWGAFIGMLRAVGYNSGLSIEPHSETWHDELGERGIDFTIAHIRERLT